MKFRLKTGFHKEQLVKSNSDVRVKFIHIYSAYFYNTITKSSLSRFSAQTNKAEGLRKEDYSYST